MMKSNFFACLALVLVFSAIVATALNQLSMPDSEIGHLDTENHEITGAIY